MAAVGGTRGGGGRVVPVDTAATYDVLIMGWRRRWRPREGLSRERGQGLAFPTHADARAHGRNRAPVPTGRGGGDRRFGLRPPVLWAMSVVGTGVQSHALCSWAFVPGSETLHLVCIPPRVSSEPQAFGTPE